MLSRLIATLALLGTSMNAAWAQVSTLDLIPAKATAAILIRNPEELRKKGDDFLKDANINLGIRPTDALNMLLQFLGINQGLDLEKPAGVVLLRPENANKNIGLEDLEQNLYAVLAYTDLDKMAANFGLKPDELKPGAVAKVKNDNQFIRHVLVQGNYIYVAPTTGPLERLRQAKSLNGQLTTTQVDAFKSADLLVFLHTRALGDELKAELSRLEKQLVQPEDPQEKESIHEFVRTLGSLRFALAGVHVGKGVGINLLAVFPKDDQAVQGFLKRLRPSGQADLKGLPDGRVVAAQSYAGSGGPNSIYARAFVHFLLQGLLESKHITSAADRPTFIGVFNEVWQRLERSRMAVYLTSDEAKLGLFSVVGILDTENAEKFLADMRALTKIADGTLDLSKKNTDPEIDIGKLIKDLSSEQYRTRASTTTRLRLLGEPALAYLEKAVANPPDLETSTRARLLIRQISAVAAERRKELLSKDLDLPHFVRPTLTFITKAETRAGLPIDVVHIKLPAKDRDAAGRMKQLFGADWDKLRLAVHGRKIVVLLGSEVELFEAAMVNLQEGKAGLAASKRMVDFAKLPSSKATATFHLSVATLLGLIQPQSRRLEPQRLTSFSLGVEDAALRLDLFMPTDDIRAIQRESQPGQ